MSKSRRRKPPAPPSKSPPEIAAPPWRFQFSLRTIFIATALCCVMAAMWGGLLRATKDPEDIDFKSLLFYMVLLIGAPMFIMIVASLIAPAQRLAARFKRRNNQS